MHWDLFDCTEEANYIQVALIHKIELCTLILQSGLDYAQQLQSFVPLLCDGLNGKAGQLVSLNGQDIGGQAAIKHDVATLGALQENILFRCTWHTPSQLPCWGLQHALRCISCVNQAIQINAWEDHAPFLCAADEGHLVPEQ